MKGQPKKNNIFLYEENNGVRAGEWKYNSKDREEERIETIIDWTECNCPCGFYNLFFDCGFPTNRKYHCIRE